MNILKILTRVTGKINTNELAQKIDITPKQLIEQVYDMTRTGFLKRVKGGYAITEKGKNALKAVTPVPEDRQFNFYIAIDKPVNMSVRTVREFQEAMLKVDASSLEFHLGRDDFQNWFSSTIIDEKFAIELADMKAKNLRGEELRRAIMEAAKNRYSL